MQSSDKLVRRFVMSLPGCFDGPDALVIYRAAYAKAGLSAHMALSEFRDALERMGFRVVDVRPGLQRLRLPEAGVGVTSRWRE